MTAHEHLKHRVDELERAINLIAQNGDALYQQFKALGDATAQALTEIEARLKQLEQPAMRHQFTDDDSAVPV